MVSFPFFIIETPSAAFRTMNQVSQSKTFCEQIEARPDLSPQQCVSDMLEDSMQAASEKGKKPLEAAHQAVQTLKHLICEHLLENKEHPLYDRLELEQKLKAVLASYMGITPEMRRFFMEPFFADGEELYEKVIEKGLVPRLTDCFQKAVEDYQVELCNQEEDEIEWDEAISRFVDDGLFMRHTLEFKEQERLYELNEEHSAKVFYKMFKQHFDTRQGMGVMEMIEVGEKHPEELKKMRLMDEYDDIRAALLKLQLTGKISSMNYR